MTTFQTTLIEKLAEKKIEAVFNGQFLNCRVAITRANGKIQWQKFSFRFDTADDLQGSALVWHSCKGTYSEAFAHDAAAIIKTHSDEIAALPIE